MKRFLALLCFCASLTGVAFADSPAGNGSSASSNQGSPATLQNAWPFYFSPGGIPYNANQYLASASTTCTVLTGSPLTWGVALVNTSASAQTATITVYDTATATTGCTVTSQRYSIVLGASQYVIVPVGVQHGWDTGLAFTLSASTSSNIDIYYL